MNIISRAYYIILTDCMTRYASRFITFCNSEEKLRKRNYIDNSDIQLVREEREVAPRDKIFSAEYYCIMFVYSARATVFYAVTLSLAKRNYPDSIIFRGAIAETRRAAHHHQRTLYFYAQARHFARPLLTVINPTGRFPSFDFRNRNRDGNLNQIVWPPLPTLRARQPVGRPTDRPVCVDKGADKIGITFRDTHVQTY